MKKLFAIGLVLLLAAACWSIDIYRGTQFTPAWDAVTEMADGSPIAPTDTISYELYYSPVVDPGNPSVLDPQNPLAHTFYGATDQLELVFDVPQDGQFYAIAVRAVLVDELSQTFYSALNWSYENGDLTPNPFLYQQSGSPASPKGLSRD